jgi:hypothetical protein
MQPLGESWDVVEVIRSLVTEVDSLQKIVAGQEARLQVLEPRPLIQVGDLVAESAEPAPGRRVKKA